MFRHTFALFLTAAQFVGTALAQAPALPDQPPFEDNIQLQFSAQSDVKEIIALYERLTGNRLIYDNTLQGGVPLIINERVGKQEAIKIIEVALLMNQVALVPTEDKKIWKVFSNAKSPRAGGGVPIYTDAALLPETEQIVSFLFKLRFADPNELAQQLSVAFPASPVLQGQSMVALPKAQALLVTENTAIIRQIVRIIRELDTQPADVESRFFNLQRADAKEIQEKLTDILTKKDAAANAVPGAPGAPPRPQVVRTPTTPEGVPIPADVPVPPDAATTVDIDIGPNEENFVAGKVKITADIRTNRLHVIARPEAMTQIAKLIEEFDANVPFGEPSVYPLRFVSAGDIFQVLVKTISDPGQKESAGVGSSTTGSRPTTGRSGSDSLFGSGGSSSSGFSRSGDGGGGGGATLSESLNAEQRDVVPDAVTIGNSRIIADKRANSIIVVGNKDVKEKLFAVIKQIDIRAPQVMLHTCIGQLTLGENEQFGVNYIMNLGRDQSNFASGTSGAGNGNGNTGGTTGGGVLGINGQNPILNIANLLSQKQVKQIGLAGATGISGFFTAGNAFDAIVNALESTNKFRVVSRPVLFTSNNSKAVIASGEEIAIPTNIQSGFAGTGNGNGLVTNSSIQFKTVALQLEVLPLINADREVAMDIVQKVDEQNGSDIIDGNAIPRIATRVLKTNVTVPNNATLVLGGLIKQRYTKNNSGVPLLSRIPLIGPLFRSTSSVKSREELVILIRPEVSVGPKESLASSERESEFLKIEPDLEQTLIDRHQRQRTAPEELMRKPAAPGLREYQRNSARPSYYKVERSKK